MKFKNFLTSLGTKLRGALERFLPAVICLLAAFAINVYSICRELVAKGGVFDDFYYSLIAAAIVAVLTRLILELLGKERRAPLICSIAALVFTLLSAFMLQVLYESRYRYIWLVGIVIAALFAILWLLYKGSGDERPFASLAAKSVFCAGAAGVLLVGLMICIFAFTELIYPDAAAGTPLWIAASLCFGLVAPVTLLCYIPQKGEDIEISKAYRALVCYVALPVFLLLLAILYVYIIKIIVSWSMPVGTMNWYGSFALAAFIALWLGVRTLDNPLAKAFTKYGGLAMLPVLAVQSVGVAIRLNAYGLTSARYVSLVCLALGAAALVLCILQKRLRPLFLVASAAALILTLTPLNALDFPVFSQEHRLKSLLSSNGMLSGGEIAVVGTPSEEDAQKIRGCCEYLLENTSEDSRSEFLKNAMTVMDFRDPFGEGAQSPYSHMTCNSYESDDTIHVSGYDCLTYFYYVQNSPSQPLSFSLPLEGGERPVDLVQQLTSLYGELGNGNHEHLCEFELQGGARLVLNYVNVTFINGEPESGEISGYILYTESFVAVK